MQGGPQAGAFGSAANAGFASTVAVTPGPGQGPGTNPALRQPTPAAGVPVGGAASGLVACPRCNSQTPSQFAYCQQCGLHLPALAPTDPAGAVRAGSVSAGSGPAPSPASLAASAAAALGALGNAPVDPQGATLAQPSDVSRRGVGAGPAWGTAVLVNRDGSDGERFSLGGEHAEIGRAGSTIAFEQDRFLARSHARIEKSSEGVRVVSLDPLNGVFRKLELPVDLDDGSVLLVGREVLRFELVDADERAAEPLVQHGVALFGSPPRAPWGRLCELLPSGGVRDVRHLNNEEVVIGREEGELVFRDDAFMSRRHAALTWDGQRARLTDLGSSNGTFVRLGTSTPLRHNDHLRMGDQLFRIELR